jgi:hypothetical protein
MQATDGPSATAQMLATVLDAGNIRDVKNIMQDVSISMQTSNRGVNISEAINSMAAITAVTLAIAERLKWMQAIERASVPVSTFMCQ